MCKNHYGKMAKNCCGIKDGKSLSGLQPDLKLSVWWRQVFIGLTVPELAFLLLCAAYCTLWIFQPFNFSPDEAMRFGVTRFLFDHGRLPVNEEAIGKIWGHSYAHRPTMFCNIAGACLMWIAAPFT